MRDKMKLPADPFEAFGQWYEQAKAAPGENLPDSMALATVDDQFRPSVRTVMWKRHEDLSGFCFFSDRSSRKGMEMESNPHVGLLFHWPTLNRQVRIEGSVSILDSPENDRAFRERDRNAQLATWVSNQSRPMKSKTGLDARMIDVKRRFRSGDITRPTNWVGYRLVPERFEFWQASPEDRLHDSLAFIREGDSWYKEFLEP